MNDQEKHQQVKSIQKRYGSRPGFKDLFRRAQRALYKDDILQPYQVNYKAKWYPGWKARQAINDATEREYILKQKELDELYRQKSKRVVTVEEKILRDLHKEHPKMTSEEDIIRWKT